MFFQTVHDDKSPARSLLKELGIYGNLRNGTNTESAAEIARVANRRAHIEPLLHVLVMRKTNKGINIRSNPNLIDAKVEVRLPQGDPEPLPSEGQIGVSL